MQHLNFYSQLDRRVEPPFAARLQLRLVAAVIVVMAAIYGVLLLGAGGTSAKLEALTAEQQALAGELNRLQAEKAQRENTPELDRAIAGLKREVQFRRRLMNTIRPGESAAGDGFAEHLAGLARQHIDGLWFTEIELRRGGEQMALLGQTRAPEYVPQYLQRLSRENVFAGHRFRVLRMHVPEERKDLHAFELRARDVGQEQ